MSQKLDRRGFLAGAAATGLFTAESYARILGANDRIQMAILGAGGRGSYVMNSFLKVSDKVEFIAVADVYEPRQNGALKQCRAGANTTLEYRELRDNKEVGAVLNATPDHWHSPVLIDSVKAGKDVYTEKPFSLSIEEGARMVEAVRATKQIVQVGMQRRSSEAVRGAKKLLDDRESHFRAPLLLPAETKDRACARDAAAPSERRRKRKLIDMDIRRGAP